MGPWAGISCAGVLLKLSPPLFSRVALPSLLLGRGFSAARGRRDTELAESGGAELSDGRQLVPQAIPYCRRFLEGWRSVRFFGLLATRDGSNLAKGFRGAKHLVRSYRSRPGLSLTGKWHLVVITPRLRKMFTGMYQMHLFCTFALYPASGAPFLALSAAGHAGGPRVHPGASVGPGRAPWRGLWAFKLARPGK